MNSLDKIITALAPIFAAGFAVQQLLEILTSLFDLDSNEGFKKYKKAILGTVAFGIGCALASALKNGVLGILQGRSEYTWTDFFATALVISAGTEGVNSILKFLKYGKETKKLEAAAADPEARVLAAPSPREAEATLGPSVVLAASEVALKRIDRQ